MNKKPYAAFILDTESRERLISLFPPRFPDIRSHHISIAFDTEDSNLLFQPETIKIVGYSTDLNGIEAILLEINGQKFRSDGHPWHITISFDKSKNAPKELTMDYDGQPRSYSSSSSIPLLMSALNTENSQIELKTIDKEIHITAKPQIILPNITNRTDSENLRIKTKHPQPL